MAMTSYDQFNEIVVNYSEEVQNLIKASRDLILEVMPDVVEVAWPKMQIIGYGTGPNKNHEHFSWLKPNKKHVTFGFNYGAELPDPSGLLEGTGKLYRHVKIKKLEDLANPAFINLIKFAITYKV